MEELQIPHEGALSVREIERREAGMIVEFGVRVEGHVGAVGLLAGEP
jgi:hypothetical protein